MKFLRTYERFLCSPFFFFGFLSCFVDAGDISAVVLRLWELRYHPVCDAPGAVWELDAPKVRSFIVGDPVLYVAL